jgi:hypothetical protein
MIMWHFTNSNYTGKEYKSDALIKDSVILLP